MFKAYVICQLCKKHTKQITSLHLKHIHNESDDFLAAPLSNSDICRLIETEISSIAEELEANYA